jgi:hypothetical protein
MAALISPFGTSGVNVRLTSLFADDPKIGPFVRSLLHVKGSDLSFSDEADGSKKVTFDVLAVVFGDNGLVVDQVGRTETVKVRGETLNRLLSDGFDYILTFPIKKAGAYQFRTALRDTASERVGSASQFVEIPDLKKNRLSLSGLVLEGYVQGVAKASPAGPNNDANHAASASNDEPDLRGDPKAAPAVRQFKKGMKMRYGYYVYNAALDKATNKPQLQGQARLFKDGQLVFTGKPTPLEVTNQSDLKRIVAGGVLQLGSDLAAGDYVLQIIVTDALTGEKHRIATQWIDFEVTG